MSLSDNLRRLARERVPTAPAKWLGPITPTVYTGLRVFDVDDAPFFFGREALVQWLLNELRPATEGQPVNRFLAIVGASGSGKSSVARAGLVAAKN